MGIAIPWRRPGSRAPFPLSRWRQCGQCSPTTGRSSERVSAQLDRRLLPALDTALVRVRVALPKDQEGHEIVPVRDVSRGLEEFEHLRAGGALEFQEETEAVGARKDRLAAVISALFDRIVARADALVELEAREARSISERARADHRNTLVLLVGGSLLALLGTLGVIAWLTRSIVPRARGYSRFAAEVAKGSTEQRLEPAGQDELTELGLLLNKMVDHREREEHQLDQQTEFSEAMQMTESEQEAYGLLKRHLERSLSGADVTVLGRNNSADRLEPRTPVHAGGPLAAGLEDARPRSCLAVRTGEQQNRTNGEEPLMQCDVCGKLGPSACQPLLVGGEVMGSVLALPDGAMATEERETMRLSVAQAAPILANLRNLAIAEQRAGTDELTGLANQRSANDAVKRMAADASNDAPLAAIVLDLDHFKQINDLYGHGAGDEVLAAVGAAAADNASRQRLLRPVGRRGVSAAAARHGSRRGSGRGGEPASRCRGYPRGVRPARDQREPRCCRDASSRPGRDRGGAKRRSGPVRRQGGGPQPRGGLHGRKRQRRTERRGKRD